MKWIPRMCVSQIIYILVLKCASGTTIGVLGGKRLEKISLVCDDVKTFCTFQHRIGVILVMLHNRLVTRTSSMQSQFTLKLLTVYECLKEVISSLNSFNGLGVVVCRIKGDLIVLLDSNFKGGEVGAILSGCEIF